MYLLYQTQVKVLNAKLYLDYEYLAIEDISDRTLPFSDLLEFICKIWSISLQAKLIKLASNKMSFSEFAEKFSVRYS